MIYNKKKKNKTLLELTVINAFKKNANLEFKMNYTEP
jgi:hypothetical protein